MAKIYEIAESSWSDINIKPGTGDMEHMVWAVLKHAELPIYYV